MIPPNPQNRPVGARSAAGRVTEPFGAERTENGHFGLTGAAESCHDQKSNEKRHPARGGGLSGTPASRADAHGVHGLEGGRVSDAADGAGRAGGRVSVRDGGGRRSVAVGHRGPEAAGGVCGHRLEL